ncbi:MAG TPA: SRPBCC domain-containing protein [Candidatus Dormibacteraeota bacterium]|jgi:uncharacterized protein YndB with AHSA1/START domain|nr:SRPBCC domain-containing protein [Candidatus Dormibacteraeota bacterium]
MVPVQIEREILIEAPIDVVWRVVTEPEHLQQWFATEAELEGRVGGTGSLNFSNHSTSYLQVEAFDPPHRFAYRWLHKKGSKARPGNSTLVEFTLQAEASHTRLRVVESGFEQMDWTDDERTSYVEDHTRGWRHFAELLRDYAPRANSANPE